jgi:hypothetical protein
MAQYKKIVDIWPITTAIMAGKIKLQSGQPIRCGCDKNGCISVFDYATPTYIRAFHGGNYRQARAKYLSVKRTERINTAAVAGKFPKHLIHAAHMHSMRMFQPIN